MSNLRKNHPHTLSWQDPNCSGKEARAGLPPPPTTRSEIHLPPGNECFSRKAGHQRSKTIKLRQGGGRVPLAKEKPTAPIRSPYGKAHPAEKCICTQSTQPAFHELALKLQQTAKDHQSLWGDPSAPETNHNQKQRGIQRPRTEAQASSQHNAFRDKGHSYNHETRTGSSSKTSKYNRKIK